MANRYTYTIDENNAILVFDSELPNEDGSANLYQPFHPGKNGEPWGSKEEAEEYAKYWIEQLVNPTDVFIIPDEEESDPNVIEVVPAE